MTERLNQRDCPHGCRGTGWLHVTVDTGGLKTASDGLLIEQHRKGVRPCPHIQEALDAKAAVRTVKIYGGDYVPDASIEQLEPASLREHVLADVSKLQNGAGMLFVGDVGIGKSHAASAVANRLLAGSFRSMTFANVSVLVTEFRRLEMSPTGLWEESRLYLEEPDLLVLDDAGSEKATPWTEALLYRIVSYRFGQRKSIVVTANCMVEELEEKLGLRTFDRLMGLCGGWPLSMKGPSRRWK